MRHTHDAKPGQPERGVTDPVALERRSIAAEGVVVELDDEPTRRRGSAA